MKAIDPERRTCATALPIVSTPTELITPVSGLRGYTRGHSAVTHQYEKTSH